MPVFRVCAGLRVGIPLRLQPSRPNLDTKLKTVMQILLVAEKVKRDDNFEGPPAYGHYDVVMSGRQDVAISSELFWHQSTLWVGEATPNAARHARD